MYLKNIFTSCFYLYQAFLFTNRWNDKLDWIEVYDGADESAELKKMFVSNLRKSRRSDDLQGIVGHWYECGYDSLLYYHEGYLHSSTNSILLKLHTHDADKSTKPDTHLPTGYRAMVDIGKKNSFP